MSCSLLKTKMKLFTLILRLSVTKVEVHPTTRNSPSVWRDTAFWKSRKSTCQNVVVRFCNHPWTSCRSHTYASPKACDELWRTSTANKNNVMWVEMFLMRLSQQKHLAAGKSIMKSSEKSPTWEQLLSLPPWFWGTAAADSPPLGLDVTSFFARYDFIWLLQQK